MERKPINLNTIIPTKRLTKEEVEKITLLPFGKKHPVRVLLEQLPVGEFLNISRLDFNWRKQNPNYFITQIKKATGKKFTTYKNADRSGWVVERVE